MTNKKKVEVIWFWEKKKISTFTFNNLFLVFKYLYVKRLLFPTFEDLHEKQ